MMEIRTKAKTKEEFFVLFESKIKKGNRLEKNIAQVLSPTLFFERDTFIGGIYDGYLWIMRPHRMRMPFAQRIFRGVYSEQAGVVIVNGCFCFTKYDLYWSFLFGVITAVISLMLLSQISVVPFWGAVFASLFIGAAFWGVLIGIDLLTDKVCEKDVIELLSSL